VPGVCRSRRQPFSRSDDLNKWVILHQFLYLRMLENRIELVMIINTLTHKQTTSSAQIFSKTHVDGKIFEENVKTEGDRQYGIIVTN
jgi:hypothetical protein